MTAKIETPEEFQKRVNEIAAEELLRADKEYPGVKIREPGGLKVQEMQQRNQFMSSPSRGTGVYYVSPYVYRGRSPQIRLRKDGTFDEDTLRQTLRYEIAAAAQRSMEDDLKAANKKLANELDETIDKFSLYGSISVQPSKKTSGKVAFSLRAVDLTKEQAEEIILTVHQMIGEQS